MSPVFSTREYERALLAKGFLSFKGSGHRRFELYVDGRATGIKTLASHSNYDVSGFLQQKMAQQLRMPDAAYLRRFVSCEVSLDDYCQDLRQAGYL